MIEAVREFEAGALATGLDTQLAARRALRAVRHHRRPGAEHALGQPPVHGPRKASPASSTTRSTGGERFFDILEQMQKDLGRHSEVVELMYLCTSLGFEGRYRVMPRGIAALTELRDGSTAPSASGAANSSANCRPLARHRDRLQAARPARAGLDPRGLGTLRAACVIYVLFNFSARRAIRPRRSPSLPACRRTAPQRCRARRSPRPRRRRRSRPPQPCHDAAPADSCSQFLAPEIKQGWSRCSRTPQSITVRLINRNMFASGSADAEPQLPAAAHPHRPGFEGPSRAA